jgi:hypothetical protein
VAQDRRDAEVTRRSALRLLAYGAIAVPLSGICAKWAVAGGADAPPVARPRAGGTARARSVVEIWLAGGPSHLDTFDPKPGAGREYCGPLDKPVATNVDGVRIGELLPQLAQQADKYSLVRSMSHGSNGHETAAYIAQTGRASEERLVYPSVGAVVSAFKGWDRGYEGRVPPYVVLTAPQGRFSEEGFLGARCRPFATGGDPAQKRFAVEGIVAEDVSDQRQKDRRELLHELDSLGAAMPGDVSFRKLDRCEDRAYDMILGDAGRVFDVSAEKDELRERYGRGRFGQSCLVARRLVESGVPYVTINEGGWDTHKQHFEAMRRKLPELDKGIAALLADLADRGLLESTVVWCCGEFGRTPRVSWEAPWNGGRGHHGDCFSALVAGGGFRGGRVVGATDARGERVTERPVHPRELHASIYELLGIDPDGPLANPLGLDVRVADGRGGVVPRLREIM